MNLGRYTDLRRTGSNLLGTTYCGQDSVLNREIGVLEVYSRIVPDTNDFKERFLMRCQNWARISHPNIVPLYEVLTESTGVFLVTGGYSGVTLEEHVGEGERIELAESLEIVRHLCDALDVMHRHNILHEHLNTDFILWSAQHTTQIYGVGVGLVEYRGKELLDLAYRYRFCSPEQSRGEIASVSTEVYSVGAILYRLLTGRPPFASCYITFLIEQILNDEPTHPVEINPSIPQALNDIILKCLAKKPEERYQSVAQLRNAIETSI